jgi:preprotein translocase subunit SecE
MNQISQLLRFTRDVRAEVSRIYWPTRAETQKLTLMVVILATLVSVYLSVVDTAIGAGLSALFGLNG